MIDCGGGCCAGGLIAALNDGPLECWQDSWRRLTVLGCVELRLWKGTRWGIA